MTPTSPRTAGRILRVPGRIEVLGKHVDYAGGRSLLCATDFGFTFEVRARRDGRVHLHDRVSGQRATIEAQEDAGTGGSAAPGPTPARQSETRSGRRGPIWSKYPRAVVERLRADFFSDAARDHGGSASTPEWVGCDIGFSSDLPSASGLSSSSAFTIGVMLAVDAVTGFLDSKLAQRAIPTLADLAEYAGAIESGRPFAGFEASVGVGVRGGSQDHTAILCSRPGALLQVSFAPVRIERYATLPPNLVFVIGVSGVRASKAAGARARYNSLSDLATRIASIWRVGTGGEEPHLGAILDSSPDAAGRLRRVIEQGPGSGLGSGPESVGPDDAGAMIRRVEQFRTETRELIPAVTEALRSGDLAAVGGHMEASQRLAETHLGNQVPETMHLAASARDVGAIAASSFGAGFGGAVWALVERSTVDDFGAAWARSYREAFPNRAPRSRFVTTEAADAADPLPARFAGE